MSRIYVPPMFIPEPPTKKEWKMYFIRAAVIIVVAFIVLFVIHKPMVSKEILKSVDKIELSVPEGRIYGDVNMSDGAYLQYRFDAGNTYTKVNGDKYFDDYINDLLKLKRRPSSESSFNKAEFVIKLYYGNDSITIECCDSKIRIDGKSYTLFNGERVPYYLFAE